MHNDDYDGDDDDYCYYYYTDDDYDLVDYKSLILYDHYLQLLVVTHHRYHILHANHYCHRIILHHTVFMFVCMFMGLSMLHNA